MNTTVNCDPPKPITIMIATDAHAQLDFFLSIVILNFLLIFLLFKLNDSKMVTRITLICTACNIAVQIKVI